MRIYNIKSVDEFKGFDNAERAAIDIYPWGCEYQPEAYAQLILDNGRGIYLKMECHEKNPLALCTKNDEYVCNDSCMEFFVSFGERREDAEFLGIEVNAEGIIYSSFGRRKDRKLLAEMGLSAPKPIPFKADTAWGFELLIPNNLIKFFNNNSLLKKGDVIYGNFYKCGDKTEQPHYGVWNELVFEQPDFSLPAQFGKLIVE